MSFESDIERYRQSGSEFAIAVRNHAARQDVGDDGSWNTTMVIHHMADVDLHFALRIREILVHENPALVVFDEQKYAERLNYADRPIEAALLLIKSVREDTAEVLLKFGESAWTRSGTRADGTKIAVSDIVLKTIDHTQEHIDQIMSEPEPQS